MDKGTWNEKGNSAATMRAYCEIPGDIRKDGGEMIVLPVGFGFQRGDRVSNSRSGQV